MSNKIYDILKFIAQIILPALGTLYFALARIWNFPYGEQVVGTIAAIDAFLGAILGLSSVKYYKDGKDIDGTITVEGMPGDENILLQVGDNVSIEDLVSKANMKFTVDASNYVGKHTEE